MTAASGTPATRYDEQPQYLIYIVLDTSMSMRTHPKLGPVREPDQMRHTPLGMFADALPPMLARLCAKTMVAGSASVCLVAFNDEPETLLPMTPLSETFSIGSPRIGHATDYAKAFGYLTRLHPADVETVRRVKQAQVRPGVRIGVASPWIYFITDGKPAIGREEQPRHQWLGARDTLVRSQSARIVTIGLPGADEGVLWDVSTGDGDRRNALIAEGPLTPRALADMVSSVISASIVTSTRIGVLTIENIPEGMRRIARPAP
ncbi:hypothetical protein [Catellatospora sp. NPDC049609]|uniref:vWA domain-containing protein n=1 Tax=Catellatospora sp. NPDC049609 TaxID=3155505 RepID=UPI0034345863